jgi:hypothetical protein
MSETVWTAHAVRVTGPRWRLFYSRALTSSLTAIRLRRNLQGGGSEMFFIQTVDPLSRIPPPSHFSRLVSDVSGRNQSVDPIQSMRSSGYRNDLNPETSHTYCSVLWFPHSSSNHVVGCDIAAVSKYFSIHLHHWIPRRVSSRRDMPSICLGTERSDFVHAGVCGSR